MRVENTYHRSEMISIASYANIYVDGRDEELFARQLASAILTVEHHESQEWLRRDGVIFDDPHKKPEAKP